MMKEINISQVSRGNTNSMLSFDKYDGLIAISTTKRLRNQLISLYDYVVKVTPPLFPMHKFIAWWRILLMLSASFFPAYKEDWGEDTTIYKVLNYISIAFAIIPQAQRPVASPYYCIIYFLIMLIFFIILFGAAVYYSKNAKLPYKVALFISIFSATFNYIFSQITTLIISEMISCMISEPDKYVNPFFIISFIMGSLPMYIWYYIFLQVYSVSINFKPDSLMVVFPEVQAACTTLSALVLTSSYLGSRLQYTGRIACIALTLCFYAAGPIMLLYKGGLVKTNEQKMVAATISSGAINCAVFIAMIKFEVKNKDFMLILYIAIWLAVYFLFTFLMNVYFQKCVVVLDMIEEDKENFEKIKSAKMVANLAVIGFRFSHPLCLNFSIFRQAIEVFPKEPECWLCFAKFISIYPEESKQLEYVAQGMVKNKLKGAIVKHCIMQINSILNSRERNLVPDLKLKIDNIGKTVIQTKRKIRYIWDLVIQGNVTELEQAIDKTMVIVEKSESEFTHLLQQYPNNRFAARAYSRFMRDVTGDYAEFKRWSSNVSLLNRGILITPDLSHELGMKAFPNLPKYIGSDGSFGPTNTQDESSFDYQNEEFDEQAANDAEYRISIRNSINKLRIPGYCFAKVLILLLLFFFFLIPVIAVSIYVPLSLEEQIKPLNYIYYISSIRTRIYQALSFSYRLIVETISVQTANGTQIFPVYDYTNQILDHTPPKSLGSTWDTREQIKFILTELTMMTTKLSELMKFKIGHQQMEKVRDFIYQQNLQFHYFSDPIYDNPLNPTHVTYVDTPSMISLPAAIAEYTLEIQDFLNKTITPSTYQGKVVQEGFSSIRQFSYALGNASELLTDFIHLNLVKVTKNVNLMEIYMCVIYVVIYIVACVVSIISIKRNKEVIYKSLVSLPKNIVSKVSDSFKILKKEDTEEFKTRSHTDEDYNRQEDSMIKIFSSYGDKGRSSLSDLAWIIGCYMVCMLFNVVTFVLMSELLKLIGDRLDKASPHINFITGAYSYDVMSISFITALLGYSHHTNLYQIPFTLNEIYDRVDMYTKTLSMYFQAMRYGDPTLGAVPFQSIGVDIYDTTVIPICDENHFPINDHETYECSNADTLISLCQIEQRSLKNRLQYGNTFFSRDEIYFKHIWHIHLYHIFDQFFSPMFEEVIHDVSESIKSQYPIYIYVLWVLYILSSFSSLILLVNTSNSEKRQKFALKLIIHCPAVAVLQNHNLTSVLSGNFKGDNIDITTRDSDFYDLVTNDMPDSIIISDLTGNIISANKATCLIFGDKEEDLINTSLLELGKRFINENPFTDVTTQFEKLLCFKKGDSTTYVDVSLNIQQENVIVTSRDTTQRMLYNQLVAEERSKSDKLLNTIIPATLVKRVQTGEKNISFAIQSASIVFIDIVSFTPWCGSLPASKVMQTLNFLFREFDFLVSNHQTMTKVKCIGDCYMAAGGIFAELDQPAVHAKDVVEFGLDTLDVIEKVNSTIGENLEIRVGINTGGPIVAGVLGTAKPTFEIIGPAINMAQQMEHHGVPMCVHISRAVYELIYGGNLKIMERGEILVKCGTVVTYLLEKRSPK